MSNGPGSDSGPGAFRMPAAGGTPPAETGPTIRLTSLGQVRDQPARDQRTRRTVDLSLTTHRALDIWQREAADRLGVARVTGQEVMTALIEELLTDPKLANQITRRIRARR